LGSAEGIGGLVAPAVTGAGRSPQPGDNGRVA
jgi:hypothetical protein